MMRKGFGELVSPIMGTISIILAHSFSCLQSLVYAQAIARKLTAIEISDLRRVFAKGLNNSVISIIEKHSGIFGLNTRIFVPGNSIYIKNKGISMDVWTKGELQDEEGNLIRDNKRGFFPGR